MSFENEYTDERAAGAALRESEQRVAPSGPRWRGSGVRRDGCERRRERLERRDERDRENRGSPPASTPISSAHDERRPEREASDQARTRERAEQAPRHREV